MANTVNYAEMFLQVLQNKYAAELKTAGLTTRNISFLNAKTINVPYLTMGGFKNHGRNGGFNRQGVQNDYNVYVLSHDRDVEFFVDAMDVDETNQALAAGNITNAFEEQQAIPETDAYRLSKLYQDFVAQGGAVDTDGISALNILKKFDDEMAAMDDAGVPAEGRLLYATPATMNLFKQAEGISRDITLTRSKQAIQRGIRSLDEVELVSVPSSRMKTAYDYDDGFTPAVGAEQINFILVHPDSVVAVNKHSYINLWTPGTHTQGDGYLYQNRQYWDLFLIPTRKEGVAINTGNFQ